MSDFDQYDTRTGGPGSDPYAGRGPAEQEGMGPAGEPAAGGPAAGGPGAGYGPVYGAEYGPVPPVGADLPNTGLATLLGFIPGVGAMYNGQFAKGLAHIVIFAVLISLANHVSGIFGLLIAGWFFYMVFDSYQTARARRDGLVAPDPFGLNTIGERLGVGHGPDWRDFTARPGPVAGPSAGGGPGAGAGPETGAAGYAGGVPGAPYGGSAPGVPYGGSVPGVAYGGSAAAAAPGHESSYAVGPDGAVYPKGPTGSAKWAGYGAGAPYAPGATPYGGAGMGSGYGPARPESAPHGGTGYAGGPFGPPPVPAGGSGGSTLPVGAFLLIGFGLLALVGSLSDRFNWTGRYFAGLLLCGLGLVLAVTRVLRARGVYPAGSAASQWYLLRSSRAGLVLLAIGTVVTIDQAGMSMGGAFWPYLLILLGVYLLLERMAYNRMLSAGSQAAYAGAESAGRPMGASEERGEGFAPSVVPRYEPVEREGDGGAGR